MAARWRRGRPAPAVVIPVLGNPAGTVVAAGGTSRCTGTRRPVEAVRSRRHAPPVRQPVLPAGVAGRSRPAEWRAVGAAAVGAAAVRRSAVGGAAVRRSAVRAARVRCPVHRTPWRCGPVRSGPVWSGPVRSSPVWSGPVWSGPVWSGRLRSGGIHRPGMRNRPVRPGFGVSAAIRVCPVGATVARAAVRRHARREPAWLAWLARIRPPGLAGPLRTGRCLAWTAQQLTVVVLFRPGRPTGVGRVVFFGRVGETVVGGVGSWTVVPAIPRALRQAVRVTAEAGVATFHQIPLLDLAVQPYRGTLALTP